MNEQVMPFKILFYITIVSHNRDKIKQIISTHHTH